MNKRYLIFFDKTAASCQPESFETFKEAWEHGKILVEKFKKNGGCGIRLLHESAVDCLASNPQGAGNNNKEVRQWKWADYRFGSIGQHESDEALIILIQ